MAKLTKIDHDGEGTIYELTPGAKYKLVIAAGKNPETGKYRRRAEAFDGTLAQARKRIAAMSAEQSVLKDISDIGLDMDELKEVGLTPKVISELRMSAREVAMEFEKRKADAARRAEEERRKPTYAQVSDEMLSEIEKHGRNRRSGEPLSRKTLNDYRLSERHMLRTSIAAMPVERIEAQHVLAAVSELRDAGLGETTVHKAFAQANRALEYARKRKKLIAFNPCDEIDVSLRPIAPKSERTAMPASEYRRLLAVVLAETPSAHMCAVLLAACNGLRIGECLGLTWGRVSLDAPIPYLTVDQQHTDEDGIHATKAREQHKTPLDAAVAAYLREWCRMQTSELNALGIERGASTLVCANTVGNVIGTSNFERWFHGFAVANGFGKWLADDGREVVELVVGADASLYDGCVVEWRDSEGWPCDELGRRYSRTYKRPKFVRRYKGITPHVLRHTFFTMRAADKDNPVSLKELQLLGGWTTPRMVTEIYTHADEQRALESGGMIDRMLSESA